LSTGLVVEGTFWGLSEKEESLWIKTGAQRGCYLDQACLSPFLLTFGLRTPVMIFLSDGKFSVSDAAIQDLCLFAVQLGCVTFFLRKYIADFTQRKPLSFHSIFFGQDTSSSSLRRMANLAIGIQNNAPRTPQSAPSAPSSFAVALDTVRNSLHMP
jgi:hypothetical protein